MGFRQSLKTGLYRLSDKRYIGRFVRIGRSTWRGPENSALMDHLQRRMESIDTTFGENLRLLEIISDMHHRQLELDAADKNLALSVPVALRRMHQAVADLHGRIDDLAATVTDVRGTSQRLVELADQRIQALSSRVDDLWDRAPEVVEPDLSGLENRLSEHAQTLTYLLERVEFVRTETMFEMRYGAGAERESSAALGVKYRDGYVLPPAGSIRLNLGCGHLPLEGYVNVDGRELPGVDLVADVESLPFESESIEEIFSAHFLEHFAEENLVRRLLPHFHSLLRRGGTLRAVVPDAGAMIAQFSAGLLPYEDLREVLFGGQEYDGDFHYNMFTAESLSDLLRNAGFVDVQVLATGRRNGKSLELEVSCSRGLN